MWGGGYMKQEGRGNIEAFACFSHHELETVCALPLHMSTAIYKHVVNISGIAGA